MRGKSLDEATVLKLFRQMISAIDFIHCRKVFHRDIKPENILLDPQCNSKLCDFGFSAIFGDGQNRQTLCGTKDYLAPEVIMSQNQNDKVDIWCMGVLLYELIHKRPPFIGKNIFNLLEDIKSAKIKFLPNINPQFRKIIEWCLKMDPNQRPTSRALIEAFPILREGNDVAREVSVLNTEPSTPDQSGSFFKKNSDQKSNVNINIGSVNINFFNQEGPAMESKKNNRDYFNVYTNLNSSQGSERVIQVADKESKQPKLSIPEKITTNDYSRFKYSVQNTRSEVNSLPNHTENFQIQKKFSEHSTGPTTHPSTSQTFITYTQNNPHRVVNSMIEQKTYDSKYFVGLKTPHSSNNSHRDLVKNQDARDPKMANFVNLNYSPTQKTSDFFDFNSNETTAKNSNHQKVHFYTNSHAKIASYSPAPSIKEYHQHSSVTASNYNSTTQVNNNPQFNNNNPQVNNSPQINNNTQFNNPQVNNNTQINNSSQSNSNPTLSKQNQNYKLQNTAKSIEVIHHKPSLTFNEVVQLSPSQLSPFSPPTQNSLIQNEQLKNAQQQQRKVSQTDQVQKIGTNYNWNRGQNVRDPNIQLVNIYKKEMNDPVVTHTNIYKNINKGSSPKNNNYDSRKYDQNRQTILKDQHGRQYQTDANNVNKFQTMHSLTPVFRHQINDSFVNKTITYSLQSVEKRQQFSSSVPRRIEKAVVEPPKVVKPSPPVPPKYIVAQNAQSGAPNRDRVIRSSSANTSEPRRARFLNV